MWLYRKIMGTTGQIKKKSNQDALKKGNQPAVRVDYLYQKQTIFITWNCHEKGQTVKCQDNKKVGGEVRQAKT